MHRLAPALLLVSAALACTPTAPTTSAGATPTKPAHREAHATAKAEPSLNPATPAQLTIVAEAPGRSASELETLVAVPIESRISGVPGLDRVESRSTADAVTITLTLDLDADLERTRVAVRERLDAVRSDLPEDVSLLLPSASASGERSLLFTVEPGTAGAAPEVLAAIASRIRERLLELPDVADIELCGRRPEQVLVTVDPRRLQAFALTPIALREALESASLVLPPTPGVTVRAESDGIEELRSTVVARAGDPPTPVFLRDLADISQTRATPECEALRVGAGELIVGVVRPRRGAQDTSVRAATQELLRDESLRLPPGVLVDAAQAPTVTLHVELPPNSPLSPERSRAEALRRALPDAIPAGREALLLAPRDGGAVDAELLLFGASMSTAELREVEEKLALVPGLHVRDIQAMGVASRQRIRLIGDDRGAGYQLAAEVARLAETVPGVLGAKPRATMVPELVIEERREALARFGLTLAQVAESTSLALGDVEVSQLRIDGRRVPVLLRLGGADGPRRPETIGATLLPLADGGSVRLDQVADIRLSTSPSGIQRIDQQRSVDVDVRLAEPETRAAVDRVLASDLVLPPGVALVWE